MLGQTRVSSPNNTAATPRPASFRQSPMNRTITGSTSLPGDAGVGDRCRFVVVDDELVVGDVAGDHGPPHPGLHLPGDVAPQRPGAVDRVVALTGDPPPGGLGDLESD